MASTREELLKKIKALPKDLQDAFFSDEISEAIIEVGKKHNLRIDKIGELGDETSSVMIGETPPNMYIKNLAARLEVDGEKAKAIAEDINQKVFQPVRNSLKKIHGLATEPSKVDSIASSLPPKPEIISPAEKKIAIRVGHDISEKIDTGESLPGMEKLEIKEEAPRPPPPPPPAPSFFAKKIELPPPAPTPSVGTVPKGQAPKPYTPNPIPPPQPPKASFPSEPPKPRPKSIAEMLDMIESGGEKTPVKTSSSIPPAQPAPPKPIPPTSNPIPPTSKDISDLEKALGGEIRPASNINPT